MPDTFTHTGKQILRGGDHFADARDVETAAQIVEALSDRANIANYIEVEGRRRPSRMFQRLARITADAIRSGLDKEEN